MTPEEFEPIYAAMTPEDFRVMFAADLKRISETGCQSFLDAKIVEKCYPESIYWGLSYHQVCP